MDQHEIPKIEIFNTRIEIHNYNFEDNPEFELFFKKYNKAIHKYEEHGIEYITTDEEGTKALIPGGFNKDYLISWFNDFPEYNGKYDPYIKDLYISLKETVKRYL